MSNWPPLFRYPFGNSHQEVDVSLFRADMYRLAFHGFVMSKPPKLVVGKVDINDPVN